MYKNLEKIRKKNNITITQMAKLISKSPANYFKKEKGEVTITVQEAIIISRFFKKKIEFLFHE